MRLATIFTCLALAICTVLAGDNPVLPSVLPGVGTVGAPPVNATLYTDGRTIDIQYNGVAGDSLWSDGLEVYLITYDFGLAPELLNKTGVANGYARFGGIPPLANLPPNTFQNGTTEDMIANNLYNAYEYRIPLPNNTAAGQINGFLGFLEFYHTPNDEGMTWVTIAYHPVKLVST